MSEEQETNAAWGGRFETGPSSVMRRINSSIAVDRRMWREDLAGSRAHAAMLRDCGILTSDDAAAILAGLDRIEAEYERDGVPVRDELEDIHMATEARLAELIGPVAGRLHTARSRNDQVATDLRLWVRAAGERTDQALAGFQRALVAAADIHAATIMPGFTHLQVAQPVTLGHHLLAYVEMAARDRSRFASRCLPHSLPSSCSRSSPPTPPAAPIPGVATRCCGATGWTASPKISRSRR